MRTPEDLKNYSASDDPFQLIDASTAGELFAYLVLVLIAAEAAFARFA